MKRMILGLAGLSALLVAAPAISAKAADMELKAPVPVISWTGCYIDGGIGYGMWNQDHYGESFPGLVSATATYTQGGRGWLGRAGGGCDYQVSPRWVIGVLGDFDFSNIHGGFTPGNISLEGDENLSWSWAVGGRIGYLVTPSLLTYFDGGFTQANFDQVNLGLLAAPFTQGAFIPSHTYSGWFLGGGTEYALNFDWLPIRGLFWRTEYRFSSFGAADLPINSNATGAPIASTACSPGAGAATPCGENILPYVQTITTSLVWRFNFGAP